MNKEISYHVFFDSHKTNNHTTGCFKSDLYEFMIERSKKFKMLVHRFQSRVFFDTYGFA